MLFYNFPKNFFEIVDKHKIMLYNKNTNKKSYAKDRKCSAEHNPRNRAYRGEANKGNSLNPCALLVAQGFFVRI